MVYIFNIVLNKGHIDLFNTVSQYFTLIQFKVVFLYPGIPCSLPHSGLIGESLIG